MLRMGCSQAKEMAAKECAQRQRERDRLSFRGAEGEPGTHDWAARVGLFRGFQARRFAAPRNDERNLS
jgi:hypothetical protein